MTTALHAVDQAKRISEDHTLDCDGPEHCRLSECDCCVRKVQRCRIARTVAFGIDTYACEECRK